jgi:hypothetical protein
VIQSKNYDGVLCTLVNVKSGQPFAKGDAVTVHNDPGGDWYLTGGRAPHTFNSTGRVYVQSKKTAVQAEYFPGVIDAQWMPEFADARFMPLEP